MRRTGWIGLLAIAMGAAFAAGLAAGRAKKPEQPPAREVTKVEAEKPKARDDGVLIASLEKFRVALAEKERENESLRAEVAELRVKLPAPLPPGEKNGRKRQEEMQKRIERWTALYDKCKPLREKILQRRDKALREQGLTEVATLIQSGQAEEMVPGLTTLSNLRGFNLDKERFRPDVVEALWSEDAEVRLAAFRCLYGLCSREQYLSTALSMMDDPSPGVRMEAAFRLASVAGPERKEEVASALRALLQDEDKSVRNRVAEQLSYRFRSSDVPGAELEDIMIELSKDKETADAAREWMLRTGPVSAGIAERLIEMQKEDGHSLFGGEIGGERILDEAKPIIRDFCLRVIRDGLDPWERGRALDRLTEMGDPSVLPQLDEIARSPDAEGIEEQLARTIERLRQKESQQR
jgi:hypothetical protein